MVLGFFNFHFLIDFVGVSRGVSRGSVDQGSVFCRNPYMAVTEILVTPFWGAMEESCGDAS